MAKKSIARATGPYIPRPKQNFHIWTDLEQRGTFYEFPITFLLTGGYN